MCGRVVYVWDAKTGKLVRTLVDNPDDDPDTADLLHKPRFNVPPSSRLPVIAGGPGVDRRIEIARWGFPIPQRPNGVFNTRIETAAESPLWRGLIGSSHCLFFVKGFYEWSQQPQGRGAPYFVYRSDGQPMLLAGLLGRRDQSLASIVTCAPNEDMEQLHDRMPVVIEPQHATDWLDGEHPFDLATPAAAGTLAMHRVGAAVGDTKNDNAGLMEPVPEQAGLGSF